MAELAKDGTPATPRAIRLTDYRPPAYQVETVELRFELDPANTRVHCRMTVSRNPACKVQGHELNLYGKDVELVRLSVDGIERDKNTWVIDDETLTLSGMPERAVVEIETLIHPDSNTALEGLYVSSGMFCTQCEAEGFRRITWFPDRPDVMARYTTTLVAEKTNYPVLLSNGNPIKRGELDDGRHWATWEDPFPKPSYLFALVAGDLACIEGDFTTRSGRKVDIRIYVEHENRHKCEHAMDSIKQAMRWDEETFGREYDLDIFMIVAVNDFNMGAMENKGLNIFNSSCVLASPETATDADYYNIQSIIGHEYFHNWSGNRVTCRDWFQLSLKEGFTVYRDQEFSADLNSHPVKRINDVNILRAHQFAQDASPMAHPVRPDSYIEISNFYTVTVYNKGAEVVRMIRTLLGAETFRQGCDLYFERHDGQAVTTDDFVAAMEDASGIDLTRFKRWYSQAGTPVIDVEDHYDPQQQRYQLTLRQHCPATPGQADKKPFHIPLLTALLSGDGSPLPLQLEGTSDSMAPQHEMLLELFDQEQRFTFTGVAERPTPSLLRGFTAPVRLAIHRDEQTLAFLLANDSDPFNRWDAGQTLAVNVLLKLVDASQKQQTLDIDATVIEAFRATLNDPRLDMALIVQALSLPSEAYLADQSESVDVDAIHAARMYFRKTLAEQLYDDFARRYQALQSDAPYRFDANDMAQRSLKNLCLSWMMETEKQQARELCVQQFEQSSNMTDTLAALSTLAQHDFPEREKALEDFYTQWKDDPQVVEKWFAIQAGSRLPETLQRVTALLEHPAFTLKNPNKVRALIGRFCQGNPVRFHAADGRGYRFLADRVLELDSMNPQIAARLVSALSRWKRYDPTRQHHMTQQLERILSHEPLSRDVFEIVSKSLDASPKIT
ncbi:aminopeptidase N [Thiogranum longum]|uniref:Aminopeptidase N n=1 Tax=Thiogranum longum TaxID=1537524 RepID=A0A4R1HC71_9GAMM|nr:aminopeptidase N [Thiogranum longum]TCK18143.1 aminopeptidase N [Thiogranum longum]